jgi:ribosomal protein S18 acetylase RimI-like enzyme
MMISEAITQEQIDVRASLRDDIVKVAPSEAATAVGIITSAFSSDPVARWMYPDPADYFTYFPRFIRGFAGEAFKAGTAYRTPDGSGAALWLAPETETDSDPLIDLFWESTSTEIQEDLFPVFDMMGEMHPLEPHWYLPMIGVDTYRQGLGAGSALLNHAVAMIDEAGLPAYLESSNPRNIPLYERFGFSVTGIIEHGKCPPIYPMYRPSR